jgi:uncharacterized protein YkwD
MTAVLVSAVACGTDLPDSAPTPWEGDAVNSLNGDGDSATDDGIDEPGADDAPVDPIDPAPDPTPEPEPTPDPDGWPAGWSGLEDEMLRLVNEFRATGGDCPSGHYGPREALRMEPALRTAARLHSEDMATNDYFDHTSQDGRSPWQRMGEAGYTGQPSAENIAAGNRAAASTFEQWRTSDGHCRNMMTQNANEIGVGYAEGGGFGSYWTQTFGAR